MKQNRRPNALHLTAAGRRSCNRRASWPPSLSSPWLNKHYALRNRAEKFGANLHSRSLKLLAARSTTAVCSRSLWRGLVLHTFCQPPTAWTPFGIVFGCAGISRSGIRTDVFYLLDDAKG